MPSSVVYRGIKKWVQRAKKYVKRNKAYKTSPFKRFNKLVRAICPNHLTVKQYVSVMGGASSNILVTGAVGSQVNSLVQGVATVGFSIYFQLKDIPQYVTYQALFDMYRIVKVKLIFKPMLPVADIVTDQALLATPQFFFTTLDFDDVAVPGTLDVIRDYQHARDRPFYRQFSIELVPRIAVATYASGVFTAFGNQHAGYIDIAYPDVQHYGVKGVLSATTALRAQGWSVYAEYIIDFKNIR